MDYLFPRSFIEILRFSRNQLTRNRRNSTRYSFLLGNPMRYSKPCLSMTPPPSSLKKLLKWPAHAFERICDVNFRRNKIHSLLIFIKKVFMLRIFFFFYVKVFGLMRFFNLKLNYFNFRKFRNIIMFSAEVGTIHLFPPWSR